MPDINLGSIYTRLDMDTSTLEQRVDEVMNLWDGIQKGAAQASTGLSSKMVAGLNQYQQKLDIIADKLERQRNLIKELEEISNRQPTGRNSYAEIERATSQLEKEKIKLKELQSQFDGTYNSMSSFIAQQDKVAKKAEGTAKKMDMRQAGANMKVGTDLAASGLRTLDQVSPGVLGNIGSIITQINAAREAMTNASSVPMKWAMGIGAAASIAVTLFVAGIQQMEEAEKERQRVFDESIQQMQDYTDKIKILSEALAVLENSASSTEKIAQANQSLSDTFPELINGYDDYGNAILANTKIIEDRIKTLNEEREEERKNIELLGKNKQTDYDNLTESVDRYREAMERSNQVEGDFIKGVENYRWSQSQTAEMIQTGELAWYDLFGSMQWKTLFGGVDTELASLTDQLDETRDGLKEYYTSAIQGGIELTNTNGKVIGSWLDMSEAQSTVANDIILTNMQDLIDNNISYEEVVKKINDTLNDSGSVQTYYNNLLSQNEKLAKQAQLEQILTKQYGQQEAAVSDLTTAYKALSEGHSLETEQLQKLAQTYPIIEEYLRETGDLSLQNGHLISDVMSSFDFTDEINSLYSLADAYQVLSEGRELDASKLYELIDNYPIVADYIAQTGDLTLQNGEILKQAYEQEQQLFVARLENLASENQAQIEFTQNLLQTVQDRIAILKEWNMVSGAEYFTATQQEKQYSKQLEEYQAKQKEIEGKIQAAQTRLGNITVASSGISSGSARSSGGGASSASSRNEALQEELKLLQHKKKMDQITSQQEYDWLIRMRDTYSMNADERMDLEYRIYAVKKKIDEDLEKAASDRLKEEYKTIENRKSLNQLSAKEELAWLQKIQKTFRMNAEERMELEIKIFNLKKQLRQEDIDSLDTIGDAVTEALKNQYEKQKENEEKRIDDSIESWKKWEEETCSAIQGQIDALDELEKQQDSEEKRREYENKRQAAELLLKYEKDDYQRKQIQMQINQMDQEEQKRLEEEAREAERERLEAELDRVKETSSKQQEALESQKDALGEQYDELLKEFNLRAQAEKAIMNSTQQEILSLIQSYAPEYDLAGQTIGEKLVDGFKSKVGDIENYLNSLTKKLSDYQADLAYTANEAADQFWTSRKQYEQQLAGYAVSKNAPQPSNVIQMTVQFNQPVESPIEIRRQMDKVAENLARQLGG